MQTYKLLFNIRRHRWCDSTYCDTFLRSVVCPSFVYHICALIPLLPLDRFRCHSAGKLVRWHDRLLCQI